MGSRTRSSLLLRPRCCSPLTCTTFQPWASGVEGPDALSVSPSPRDLTSLAALAPPLRRGALSLNPQHQAPVSPQRPTCTPPGSPLPVPHLRTLASLSRGGGGWPGPPWSGIFLFRSRLKTNLSPSLAASSSNVPNSGRPMPSSATSPSPGITQGPVVPAAPGTEVPSKQGRTAHIFTQEPPVAAACPGEPPAPQRPLPRALQYRSQPSRQAPWQDSRAARVLCLAGSAHRPPHAHALGACPLPPLRDPHHGNPGSSPS